MNETLTDATEVAEAAEVDADPVDPVWVALLDRLESDLAEPEPVVSPWTKPETPLPPALADRARRLQQRQQERMRQVRAELDGVRHHLDALRRVPPGRGDAPAYLDIDG